MGGEGRAIELAQVCARWRSRGASRPLTAFRVNPEADITAKAGRRFIAINGHSMASARFILADPDKTPSAIP